MKPNPEIGDIWKYTGITSEDKRSCYLILEHAYRDGYTVLRLNNGETLRHDTVWLKTHCRKIV